MKKSIAIAATAGLLAAVSMSATTTSYADETAPEGKKVYVC